MAAPLVLISLLVEALHCILKVLSGVLEKLFFSIFFTILVQDS